MTYLSFLAIFLLAPIAVLALLARSAARRGWPGAGAGRLPAMALLVHVLVAMAYTTPWDNYLVATRVWWYDPARVLGVTLGWVPLEEYLFFVLQPIFTGLLLFMLWRRVPAGDGAAGRAAIRLGAALGVGVLWLAAVAALAAGPKQATYLGLELAWALPPIGLQLAVGADILWRYRRRVFLTIGAATLYLAAADLLAIRVGVWTIDPAQSLGLLIGGILPVEEGVFFLLTNTLVVFGVTLALAPETWRRWRGLEAQLRRGRPVRGHV